MSDRKYTRSIRLLDELMHFGIKLGLERIDALLSSLANPEENLTVVHVAGTNGKGSTAAMLASVLTQSGYRTGLYTSPHLAAYTERISINGRQIAEETFSELLAEVVAKTEAVFLQTKEKPTEFEVLTAMAFLHFFREKTDIVIIEAGLGGDNDSTNIIAKPIISIITNVELDHMAYLGPSIREIASRKAGVIKPGIPIVTASDKIEALEVLHIRAREQKAELHIVQEEMAWESVFSRGKFQSFRLKSKNIDYGCLDLPLLGEHQIINAATAVLALEIMKNRGINLDASKIRQGLKKVCWPGRLEKLREDPCVIIDGAHNPAGMKALALWLKRYRDEYTKIIMIIGMLEDKDRKESIRMIEYLVDEVVITKVPSERSGNWQELGQFFPGKLQVQTEEDNKKAFAAALSKAEKSDLVIVAGSLYLIAEARKYFSK